MIKLDEADNFMNDLAKLMVKHGLRITVDDPYSQLSLDRISPDEIDKYLGEILDNTARI